MSAVITSSRMDRSRFERNKNCVKTRCNRAYDNELRFHFPSRAFYPKKLGNFKDLVVVVDVVGVVGIGVEVVGDCGVGCQGAARSSEAFLFLSVA